MSFEQLTSYIKRAHNNRPELPTIIPPGMQLIQGTYKLQQRDILIVVVVDLI